MKLKEEHVEFIKTLYPYSGKYAPIPWDYAESAFHMCEYGKGYDVTPNDMTTKDFFLVFNVIVGGRGAYWYGMSERGFAPGAQPMKGLVFYEDCPKSETGFYSILGYASPLSVVDMSDYELEYIG